MTKHGDCGKLKTNKRKEKARMGQEVFEPFATAYLRHLSDPVAVRLGYALAENAKVQPVVFMEDCRLPKISPYREQDVSGFTFSEPFSVDITKLEKRAETDPAYRDLRDALWPYIPSVLQMEALPESYHRFVSVHALWGGTWGGHGNPDYGRFLRLGLDGMRQYIDECAKDHPGKRGAPI